jgi:hypothetical protein
MRDLDRVKMIQAIRDLAQYIEDHPELPCPNSVRAQHSLIVATPDNEGIVRDVAAMLGDTGKLTVNDTQAYVLAELSAYPESVDYTVHGNIAAAVES